MTAELKLLHHAMQDPGCLQRLDGSVPQALSLKADSYQEMDSRLGPSGIDMASSGSSSVSSAGGPGLDGLVKQLDDMQVQPNQEACLHHLANATETRTAHFTVASARPWSKQQWCRPWRRLSSSGARPVPTMKRCL